MSIDFSDEGYKNLDAVKKIKKGNTFLAKIPAPIRITLVIVLFFLGLYAMVSPFLPMIYFAIYGGAPKLEYYSQIEQQIFEKEGKKVDVAKVEKKIPVGRRLVIPKIHVDMAIVEGDTDSALIYGVWRRPLTGTINQGNMVLTGHRLGPGFLPQEIMESSSFYNLDKLDIGDYVLVYWDGKEYDYQVFGQEEVDPTEVRIEANTPTHQITMYTCTPIGINNKRLVKYARPIKLNGSSDASLNKNSSSESSKSDKD